MLKTRRQWVHTKSEAQAFLNLNAAIEFSHRHELKACGFLLCFGSAGDVLLDPRDRSAAGKSTSAAMTEAARLMAESVQLEEDATLLCAEIDGIIARAKRRRKAYDFKPKGVRKPNADEGRFD